jgi:hypothetical protein
MVWRWASGLVGPLLFFDLVSSLLHLPPGCQGKRKNGGRESFRWISKYVSNISKTELCLKQFTKICKYFSFSFNLK